MIPMSRSVTREIPPERRAVRLRDIKNIIDSVHFLYQQGQCPACGQEKCMNVQIEAVGEYESLTGMDPYTAVVQTVVEHPFVKFDEVTFSKPNEHSGAITGFPEPLTGNAVTASAVRDPYTFVVQLSSGLSVRQLPEPLTVKEVRDPYTFVVQLSRGVSVHHLQEAKFACSPLNMHHLAAEGVIPATTVEERVAHLETAADVDALLNALQPEGSLMLESEVPLSTLPKNRPLRVGLTVHGRLHPRGHIRRHYWKQNKARNQVWFTSGASDFLLEALPFSGQDIGEMECFARRDQLKPGMWIVLRRGVSYAEVCEGDEDGTGLQVDDFISHNWSEPSREFLATLKNAKVGNCWVCTFAVLQHCVKLESQNDNGPWYETTPFYQALMSLKKTKGRVTMCLDGEASTITRIWCIFEIWVSTDMDLSFRLCNPLGELSENQKRDLYKIKITRGEHKDKSIADRMEGLSVRNAEASFPQDKIKILSAIYDKKAPFDFFFWLANSGFGRLVHKCTRGIGELLFPHRWSKEQVWPEGDDRVYNDDGCPVVLGTKVGYEFLYYCGREDVAESADRMCGPDCGTPCESCKRFQKAYKGYIVTGAEGDWKVCNGTYWLVKFNHLDGPGEFRNENKNAVIRFVPPVSLPANSIVVDCGEASGWRMFLRDESGKEGCVCPYTSPQGECKEPPSGEWMAKQAFTALRRMDSMDSDHVHFEGIHVIELNDEAERAVEWQVKKQCMLGPPLMLARLLNNTANVFFGTVVIMLIITSWLHNSLTLWMWTHSGLEIGLILFGGCGWLWIRHLYSQDPWFKGLRKSLMYSSGFDRIFVMLSGFELLGFAFFAVLFPIISYQECSDFEFCSVNAMSDATSTSTGHIDCVAVLVMPGVRKLPNSTYPKPLFDTATYAFTLYGCAKILAWLFVMLLPPGVTVAYWRVSPCFGYIFMIVSYTLDLRSVEGATSFEMVRFYWAGVWAWVFFRIWRNCSKWVRRYRRKEESLPSFLRKADGKRWGVVAVVGFSLGCIIWGVLSSALDHDYAQNCQIGADGTLPLTLTAAPMGLVIWLLTAGVGRSTLMAICRCGKDGFDVSRNLRTPLYDTNSVTSALLLADRI